uniref:Uncharacterized protein n=1 Tax=Nelumbo nucifera TaxID=4432 RepID=A0A822Y6C6_NELNU|nr:TPA_asm: hypothetical protein HUJ06_031012 [Nelumbo nucifera]
MNQPLDINKERVVHMVTSFTIALKSVYEINSSNMSEALGNKTHLIIIKKATRLPIDLIKPFVSNNMHILSIRY